MKEHKLKTWPEFFSEVIACRKRFELRRNDRDFAVGDTLVLQEWDPFTRLYSGRESRHLVGYMLTGVTDGIEPGYCVLSLVDRLPHSGEGKL